MMRLRASLCVLLLVFCIPAAWADSVNVTTVVDEDNVANVNSVNTGCSLREALHFMELSTQDRLNGYGGCYASAVAATTDTIVLPPANTINANVSTYQLTLGEILVRASVIINGTPASLITSSSGDIIGIDSAAAQNIAIYPTIQAAPNSRIFTVTHYPPQLSPSTPGDTSPGTTGGGTTTLTLTDVKLAGCGSTCALNGGIINVDDALVLNTVRLKGGAAVLAGGAVYVGGTGSLTATGSDFEGNSAGNGAAIDVAPNDQTSPNSVSITSSSLIGNTATTSGGAVLEVQASQVNNSSLTSSTVSGNTAVGVRARLGMAFKNDTIVNNIGGGIDWQGSDLTSTNISMYNTLVAANPQSASNQSVYQDCLNTNGPQSANPAGGITTFNYNVFGASPGCSALETTLNSGVLTTIGTAISSSQQVIATLDSSGNCPTPDQPGMLCPLSNNNGGSLTSFLIPRLQVSATPASLQVVAPTGLTTLQKQAANLWLQNDEALNLLVNHGAPTSTNGCVTDQRGDAQRTNSCDIGSIAIQGPLSINQEYSTPLGQTVSGAFVMQLGDVSILPGFACAQVTLVNNPVGTNDGCFKQLGGQGAAKGTMSIDPVTHDVIYTPGSLFYGTDSFSFMMATTLSRFSDASTDPQAGQFVQVNVVIQTTPLSVAQTSEVHAGAWSGLELLGLGGLFVVRAQRRRRLA